MCDHVASVLEVPPESPWDWERLAERQVPGWHRAEPGRCHRTTCPRNRLSVVCAE